MNEPHCSECGKVETGKRIRGMCMRCYHKFHVRDSFNMEPYTLDCECTSPIVERLPLWETAQCGRCGKRVQL